MTEYSLTNTKDGFQLCNNGQPVIPTDILGIYPDKRVYALYGGMGAGKTTFLRLLCEAMGVTDTVNSPTFSIVNVYSDAQSEDIYHFDCYRIKNLREALDLGAEEYLHSGCYCFIEWPEQIASVLPDDTVDVLIEEQADGSRKLIVR